MYKKGGLVLSTIILIVVFVAGFVVGFKFNIQSEEMSNLEEKVSNLEEENTLLDSQIEILKNNPNYQEACESAGGVWEIIGNSPPEASYYSCNLPTSDAGTSCTDSSECESYCQAEPGAKIGEQASGTCYTWKLAECMDEVKNGIVEGWCV